MTLAEERWDIMVTLDFIAHNGVHLGVLTVLEARTLTQLSNKLFEDQKTANLLNHLKKEETKNGT